jgi:probable biosynthetic protein (TIGR04098 family)
MNNIIEIIKNSLGAIDENRLGDSIEDLGIDSIDLFDLRVNLDNAMGFEIADSDWVGFTTFQDMIQFYDRHTSGNGNGAAAQSDDQDNVRRLQINMPQMALEALSENWLFKEIGDFHWNVLCSGLNADSSNIQDEFGNRLYATFVRIRLQSTGHLKSFKENEHLRMSADMERYGNSMYFSKLGIDGPQEKSIQAELMTTFSYRDAQNNKSLKKGQPFGVENSITNLGALPDFGQEYRLLRKRERQEVSLLGETFPVHDEVVYEREYEINPYLDLNGVNLLYFAAYPTINDVCESYYCNDQYKEHIREHWAKEAFTVARDVYYLNNCNLTDTIVYRIHEVAPVGEGRFKIHSTLNRKSDGQYLARIFTIKELSR